MRRVAAALVVAVLSFGALTACDDGQDSKPSKADRLPDVTLAGFDGAAPVDLGELKGPAVVNLWAWWCGPCKKELPFYADFARTYAGRVDVLGVNFQETNTDKAKALLAQSGVEYPNVVDADGKLRAVGLPKVVLIDANGRIAFQEYDEIKSEKELEDLVAKHLGVTSE